MKRQEIVNSITKDFIKNSFDFYEVGGSVRDYLLQRECNDFDFATNAHPEQIKNIVNKYGSVYDVGEKFGTIGFIIETGDKLEITTYRKEVYFKDSRKPDVEFGEDLIEDLARRDFTINSIAKDPVSGIIVDPFGGVSDLKWGIIRCVGSSKDRFNEDPLRMLRAIRFACQLGFSTGIFEMVPDRLKIVSKERIRDEFSKIILSLYPYSGLKMIYKFGLMKYVVPKLLDLVDLDQGENHKDDAFWHSLFTLSQTTKYDFGEDNLVFRLACLFHDIGKLETRSEENRKVHFYQHHKVSADKTRDILRELKYDNDTIERVANLIYCHMTPLMTFRDNKFHRKTCMKLIRKLDKDLFLLIPLAKCDRETHKIQKIEVVDNFTKQINGCLKEKPKEMKSPLNGDEIMNRFDLKPGKIVGEVKDYLTDLVLEGSLNQNDKKEAYNKVMIFLLRGGLVNYG